MADRLTQLQDFVDHLLNQMFASLSYIYNKHPYGDPPAQPSQAPQPAEPTANGVAAPATNGDASQQTPVTSAQPAAPSSPKPDPPDTFNAVMHEMAQDLVLKEQQIEIVIKSLPGIGVSEADQNKRMRELEGELRQLEEARAKKEVEKQAMIDLLGDMIGKVKRVP